ncbi:ATP-binding protein [Deinococcus sp.]|uniref:ATP-binding protein n=1 Tax=Deinococcus sp. TaxID=47478 RepID=UPI003C7BE3FF
MSSPPDPGQLQALLDQVSGAVFTLDAGWSLVDLNAQAGPLLGLAGAATGHNLLERWPALRAMVGTRTPLELLNDPPQTRAQRQGGPEQPISGAPLLLAGPRPDTWYEVRLFAAPVFFQAPDAGARGRAVLGMQARDVTTEQADRQELRRLREIVASSPGGVKVLDLDGRLLWMNEGRGRTMKIPEEVSDLQSGQNLLWPSFWESESRPLVEVALERARAGESSTFEGEARTFAGNPKWWEVSVSPLHAEDGSVGGLLAVSHDITRHRQTQVRGQVSEQRWRRLVEASPLGIAVGTLDGRLIQVNEAYVRLLGYTRAEFEAGQIDWVALTPPEFHAADEAAISEVLSGGGVRAYEKEMLTKDGERLPVSVVLIRDDEERENGAGEDETGAPQVLGYLQDLRPFRAAQQALREHGQTLEGQVAVRTAELEERNAALDAFVRFTEVSAQTTEVSALAEHVRGVLQATLGQMNVGYSEYEGGLWKARMLSDEVPEHIREIATQGIPADMPALLRPFEEGGAVFVDGRPGGSGEVGNTGLYTAAAFYPYLRQGRPFGLLTVAKTSEPTWTERERSIFRSVGLSLQLALERTEATRRLEAQNAELDSRARALEGFADLTRTMTLHAEPHTLVRRAQEMVLSLLPDGYTLYYERRGEHWHNAVQTGEVGSAQLQVFIDAGPPVGQTPSIDTPWHSRQPLYQDEYAKGSDTDEQMVQHVNAAATLPVLVGGQSVGVFVACVFQARPWKAAEKAVMEAVVYSLGLALERAEQARQLDEERAALEAFTTYTEAIGSELDVSVLIGRAAALLSETRGVDVLYFERETREEHAVFRIKTWPHDLPPDLLARCRQGFAPEQHTFAAVARKRRAIFFEHWNTAEHEVPESAIYGAVAYYPFFQDGQMNSVLGMASRDLQTWSKRDRGIFQAVGRSLKLALERAEGVSALAQRSQELERSLSALAVANEELEAFAYSASHDLRTPVRHVLAFADLANKALADAPNAKAAGHLAVVHQAGERMTALIDAMLLLSRAGRQEFTPRLVDLGALVTQARRDVGAEFRGRPIRWTSTEPMPGVWGDAGMLQQVLTNLLSNAVKYSALREVSVVEIRVETRPAEWSISVSDNGVGFNPQYAQKLFGVFQRLHNERDFEGTGIGLATVRRIVLKHGGRVFAESTPGEGAVFGFTLPRPALTGGQDWYGLPPSPE